jgi:hypothetical protein
VREGRMKPSVARTCLIVISFALALGCVYAQSGAIWYQKRIVWKYGADAGVLETTNNGPDKGEQYQFGLVPLWSVEGGVIAMEILVSNSEHPNDNLLGPRDNSPHPFVVEVKELRHGINGSRFSATRRFDLERTNVIVKIKGSRLGKGVGCGSIYCKDCDNIQEFTAEFSFVSK